MQESESIMESENSMVRLNLGQAATVQIAQGSDKDLRVNDDYNNEIPVPAFSKLKSVDGMSHQSGLKKSSTQTQKNNNESQELVRNNTVPLFLKAPGAQANTIKDRLRGMKDPIVSFREKVIDIDS